MLIRKLELCEEFTAGDHTLLRELLHPDKATLELRYSLAQASLKPRRTSTPHALTTSEVYYVLEGVGVMHIDEESREVSPGDVVYIPPGARQYIENAGTEDLKFLCIVDPAWREENEQVF